MQSAFSKRCVCAFSFAFTAFSAAILLLLMLHPVTSTLRFSDHSHLARLVELLSFVLAVAAGIRSAKVGVWVEARRR
jgi:hypothetical protein